MTSGTTISCILAGALALSVGCAPDIDDDLGEVTFRPGGGGVWLNTSVLGVLPLSELDLGGALHKGVALQHVRINKKGQGWVTLDKVWSEEGQLHGSRGGAAYSGLDFAHSRWELTIEGKGGATPATMWIDEVSDDAEGWHYVFAYDNGEGTAHYLCDNDPGDGHRAAAIADLTVDPASADMAERPETLYIACISGAVGKAVEWGYRPWELGVDDFEAVVRVIRADYCGDGVSWTKPGTSIQLADVWEIHGFEAPIGATEALWGRGGAICLSQPRADMKVACPGGDLPACDPGASLTSEPGALVWTKIPPKPKKGPQP